MADARVLHRFLLLSILLGIAFSLYAMVEALVPAVQASCNINPFFSCGAVTQSRYSSVGPVPDWSVGLGGFLLLLALDVPLLRSYDLRWLRAVLLVGLVGLAVAIGFGVVELALIHAFCPVCLGAYLSDVAVVTFALGLYRLHQREGPRAARAGDGPAVSPPAVEASGSTPPP